MGRQALRVLRVLLILTGLAAAATVARAQPLIWPGEKMATIDGEHLRAYVPYAHRERLRWLVAQADQIYGRMMQDAGFVPRAKLRLLISDWEDAHNGFSFVVPFPLVQMELAPALTESSIFSGHDEYRRTLVHEFAHQISNDRNHGFRGVLENIFGRVLPNDILSFVLFYLSTPAHQTMPFFWHEGLATWAETAYADAESPWGGRGRDPLVHMVWRLDTAGKGIPEVGEWRRTWQHWPFGNRVYIYGVAYARYLDAAYGDRASIWEVIDAQARRWPYLFNSGARAVLGKSHIQMIREARAALRQEQQAALAKIRSQPVTTLKRLTPKDFLVAAPAWLEGGRLVFAAYDPSGRPRLHYLDADDRLEATSQPTHARGNLRSDGRALMVYHEFNWRRLSRIRVAGYTLGWRLLQPDLWATPDKAWYQMAAIHLPGGGRQDLVLQRLYLPDSSFLGLGLGASMEERSVVPTEGRPWSPTFRPQQKGEAEEKRQLLWVETDRQGSRLVLASLAKPAERQVLLAVKGRILHPVWSQDGRQLFYCADHTGVANAYRLSLDEGGKPSEPRPVTNTIGGVLACVPSPDGRTLALVEHDAHGPYLAKLANDPEHWAAKAPEIELPWPAPSSKPRPVLQPLPAPIADLDELGERYKPRAYSGLWEMRPLFWTPTTLVVPEGGVGVSGLAADPLLTHIAAAGAGVGLQEGSPVGYLGYAYLGMPLHVSVSAWQAERTLEEQIEDSSTGERFDYTEIVRTAQVRVGRGLAGLERQFIAFATYGYADYEEVQDSVRKFAGRALGNTARFTGNEEFLGFTLGYDDATFFPTSYAPEDGVVAMANFRHSGLGGELERNRAFGNVSAVLSVWPEKNHQVVLGGQVGWSDGDRTLQGAFLIGGLQSAGLPRGYLDAEVAGGHLLAWSGAYRAPVFQHFKGMSTTPFRHRQLVLEAFFDAAKVSDDHIAGDGDWFRSVGLELHTVWEFGGLLLEPGIGVALQLDGDYDGAGYFSLGFRL